MLETPKDIEKMTPLMRQYWDIKSAHADKILMFRMGDFYEMFYDDAVNAAPVLGIALTQRNKKSDDYTPMCGMPHHSVAGPINKLLAHGFKVAICDQLEDPKSAKGIVKRGVTRILTPGMVFDSDTLDGTKAHYVACYENGVMAFLDATTGETFYYESSIVQDLFSLLNILPVAEVVVASENQNHIPQSLPHLKSVHDAMIESQIPNACRRLVSYATHLAGVEIQSMLRPFEKRELLHRLEISPTTLRHLEVFETYKGEVQGSLFKAINRTQSSSGARLLRQWICFPLRQLSTIQKRQDLLQNWMQDLGLLKQVRVVLAQMGDIERRLGRISSPGSNGRDLVSLSQSLRAAFELMNLSKESRLSFDDGEMLHKISTEIENTLLEEQPISTKNGHLIKSGLYPELDELILLSTDSQALVQKMEQEEKEKTGISSLKIRYNNVFGFYIEITNTHKDKAPAHYLRKQTLTNAERYCTDELVELEKKVLTAQTRRAELETEIFERLKKKVLSQGSLLSYVAQLCSELDVLTSLAWLALEQKYVRPEFNSDSRLILKMSRHPVVEQEVKYPFVPNDIILDHHQCLLLTGPNMAGKSTLMRQVAVSVLMAQMGSFIPASSANLPLFDCIYTRIGASDQLSEGLSTFMVEMKETSEMLKNASQNSLVILDEVGRGTSTYDGMCLAQSILEFLLTEKRCLTFFATHYHELTTLDQSFTSIFNAHMSVVEKNGDIRFLHTLQKGPALKSYGIQVAQLAGLPQTVTKRARSLLKDLEKNKVHASSQLSFELHPEAEIDQERLLEVSVTDSHQWSELKAKIQAIPINQLTPIEALNYLAEIQKDLIKD